MKLLNFISPNVKIDKNLSLKENQKSLLSFDEDKKEFFELLSQTLKENSKSNSIEDFSKRFLEENTNAKISTNNISEDLSKSNIQKENIDQERKQDTLESNQKSKRSKKEIPEYNFNQLNHLVQKETEYIIQKKENQFVQKNKILNQKLSIKENLKEQKIVSSEKNDLNLSKENQKIKSEKNFILTPMKEGQVPNQTLNKQNLIVKNEIQEEVKKITFFTSNITKKFSIEKNFPSKQKSNMQSKKKEKVTTKEILQNNLKEPIKPKENQISENSLGGKNHQSPAKMEIFIKQEVPSSFYTDLSQKQNKKQLEITSQKDAQIKNFIEQNFSFPHRINSRISENPIQNPADKSIREALEELIQKAKINIGKESFSAQIRLNPAIFGYMSLDMKFENQSLILKILVDNQEIYKGLQKNLDSLKNEFIKNGIPLDQLQIRIKDMQLSNQNDFQFSNLFSDFDNRQNHSSSKNYENFYEATISGQFNTQENVRANANAEANATESQCTLYDSKINVWG